MDLPYETVLQSYLRLPGTNVNTPEGVEAFNNYWGKMNQLSLEAFNAVQQILEDPAQRESFVQNYGTDPQQFIEGFKNWWLANGHQVGDRIQDFPAHIALLDAIGYQVNPEAVSQTFAPNDPNAVPVEQVLGQTALDRVNADLAADPRRQEEAQTIVNTVNRNMDDALLANQALTGTQFDSAGYLRANPDVNAWAIQMVQQGQYPDVNTAAKAHFDIFGAAEGRNAPQATRLQLENYQADDVAARLNASAQAAATTKLDAINQRMREMTAALDRMQGDRSGALDAQTAQLRQGLAQLELERREAQQELARARVAAAETEVTGINLGLQAERDRIVAENAKQGFIGGSTMQDSALARATIGARQEAARSMGGAKVANAMDVRQLGDEIANARYGITGLDATTRRGITDDTSRGRFSLADSISGSRVGVSNELADAMRAGTDTGTRMRATYFDNDLTRRLQSSLFPIELNKQRLNLIDVPSQIGQSGYNRLSNFFNLFSTNQGAPPTSTFMPVQPSTTGTGIAQLGAGLTSAALAYGNANNWGVKPTVPTGTGWTQTGSGSWQPPADWNIGS